MTQLKQSSKLGTAAQTETVNLTEMQGLGQTLALLIRGTADGSVEASLDGVAFFDVAGLQAVTASTGVVFETPLAAVRLTVNSTTGNLTPSGFTFAASDSGAPNGITTDGEFFYVIYSTDNTIHQYTGGGAATGVTFSAASEVGSGTDVVYHNGVFIIIDNTTDAVYFYDSVGNYTGKTFSVSAQASDPRGVATDGNYIYVADVLSGSIYTYTMDGGYTGRSFSPSGGTAPQAVLHLAGFLWVADSITTSVTQYTLDGVATGLSFSTALQDTIPVGITYKDGNYVMLGTASDTAYGYYDEITNSAQLQVLGK